MDALAQIGATVFLSVSSLDECPATGLAEGNVGLATVIIQRTGIDCSKAPQVLFGLLANRTPQRLQMVVSGGLLILMAIVMFLD